MKNCIWLVLLVVNLITLVLFGSDKGKAERGEWRIPERVLLIFSLAGGAAGACIGMKLFHHKTRKPLFAVGIPLMLVVQIGLMLVFL